MRLFSQYFFSFTCNEIWRTMRQCMQKIFWKKSYAFSFHKKIRQGWAIIFLTSDICRSSYSLKNCSWSTYWITIIEGAVINTSSWLVCWCFHLYKTNNDNKIKIKGYPSSQSYIDDKASSVHQTKLTVTNTFSTQSLLLDGFFCAF